MIGIQHGISLRLVIASSRISPRLLLFGLQAVKGALALSVSHDEPAEYFRSVAVFPPDLGEEPDVASIESWYGPLACATSIIEPCQIAHPNSRDQTFPTFLSHYSDSLWKPAIIECFAQQERIETLPVLILSLIW